MARIPMSVRCSLARFQKNLIRRDAALTAIAHNLGKKGKLGANAISRHLRQTGKELSNCLFICRQATVIVKGEGNNAEHSERGRRGTRAEHRKEKGRTRCVL